MFILIPMPVRKNSIRIFVKWNIWPSFAPCSAAQSAISLPMPLEAPVTTTTRPARRVEPPTIGEGCVECSWRYGNTVK